MRFTKNKGLTNERLQQVIRELGSRNGIVRQRARRELVSVGKQAVECLAMLVDHPDVTFRWEVVKTLGQIADPDSTPFLIQALSDKDIDVRWLAAEGLAALGERAIEPLLKELIRNPDDPELREGAHRFFKFTELGDNPRVADLLSALEHPDPRLFVPVAAEDALRNIGTIHLAR